MALRDQWLAQRQSRQAEVQARRAIVQTQLTDWQQARQAQAAQLRQELAQFHDALQAETQLFLAQAHQHQEARARRIRQELATFHQDLQSTVAQIRAFLKDELAALHQDTQAQLAQYGRDRAAMAQAQAQELQTYVANLQGVVADYLAQVQDERQRAAVVDRAQRHQDRAALTQEVQAMFADLAIFRQQLETFRQQLRHRVWGDAPAPAPDTPALITATEADPAVKVIPKATAKVSKKSTLTPPSISIPAPLTPVVTTNGGQGINGSHTGDRAVEESVFGYLQRNPNGARLTEIESNLGINRFQAVDALRSLIQQELIVQRDRTYHVQEEAPL